MGYEGNIFLAGPRSILAAVPKWRGFYSDPDPRGGLPIAKMVQSNTSCRGLLNMISLNDILRRREAILAAAAEHGAHNLRLFGSVVRGQVREGSDLDVLVALDPDRSLLDHVALIQDLEDLLGCRVDVVNESVLHRSIRDRVLAEALPL
jgi:hypothetical protein